MIDQWFWFESMISFLEMLTSCFFASRLFRKEIHIKKEMLLLLLFSLCGMVMLSVREYFLPQIPDYVPALTVFFSYAFFICKARIWASVLWALLNYLMIGIVTISVNSILGVVLEASSLELELRVDGRLMKRVITRLGQLLLSEAILFGMNRFKRPVSMQRKEIGLLLSSIISIALLMVIYKAEPYLSEEMLLSFNVVVCLLILVFNFVTLFYKEVLFKEKQRNEELKTQNQIVCMQIRNQDEIMEIYRNLRSLKHDMNTHLHTISGYMQISEYQKAEDYIQKIVGEISNLETFRSGNNDIDILIGSKSALARKWEIPLLIEMEVPDRLQIDVKHLAVLLGNLYDNAMDANRQITDISERYIHIQIKYRNQDLLIFFENAVSTKQITSSGAWETTKADRNVHGFGIKNIDRIVQMYGGYCQREQKGAHFICSIRLPDIKIEDV